MQGSPHSILEKITPAAKNLSTENGSLTALTFPEPESELVLDELVTLAPSLSLSLSMLLLVTNYLGPISPLMLKFIDRLATAEKRKIEAEERQHEAEQRQREAEQHRNFICHELRNPLHKVHAGVDLLKVTIDKLLSSSSAANGLLSELQEPIAIIKAGAQLGSEIAEDVLDLARFQAGKAALRKDTFNVKDTIKTIAQLMTANHPLVENKDIEINYEVDEVDQFIQSDKPYLTRILNNLLSNALKFTHKGYIKITATLDPAVSTPPPSQGNSSTNADLACVKVIPERLSTRKLLRCSVEDTGEGMDEKGVARLFQEFAQAQKSTRSTHGGTGLGLFICKQLSELMGGEITVTSEKGKGTTFTFTLRCLTLGHSPRFFDQKTTVSPIKNPSKSPVPFALPPRHPFTFNTAAALCDSVVESTVTKKRVLVVDDDPINQKIISRMLVEKALSYDIASNGLEAIAKYKSGSYDLILMDVIMPVIDGLEATKQIRATPKYSQAQTPIIALTGNAFVEDKQKAEAAGMVDYLTKPFSRDKIFAVLARFFWPHAVDHKLSDELLNKQTGAPPLQIPSHLSNFNSPRTQAVVTTSAALMGSDVASVLLSNSREALANNFNVQANHSISGETVEAVCTFNNKHKPASFNC